MARGMPSMVALLGLLALAGYQNKDKIAEMMRGSGRPGPAGPNGASGQTGLEKIFGNLGGMLGGGGAGTILSGGLGELLERFKQKGQGETASSWVKTGPNQPITTDQLEETLGAETLNTLQEQTGLSREELLSRLTRTLPEAVDKYTPDGTLPRADEAARA
ncbi:MAG: YidB family protein [Rhizobiales bacterium]|nr:YidB family protein [Hyphomicrobiales bacterium]